MYIPVPFFEIIEQQRINVLKHTYPWLLSVKTKTYLQGALTIFDPTARLANPHFFLILILTRFIKMICSFNIDGKRHWALVNIKALIRQETPHFWSYVSPILVRTSLSLVVRCRSTSFCLKSSFASLRSRCFALIRILCRFIKFLWHVF